MDPAPIVCPLCEHAQLGGEACEVCGRPFGAGRADGVPVATLPELETTAFAWTGAPAAEVMPELERNQAEPVEVDFDQAPDMESHLAAPVADEAPPSLLGLTCRYCRAEALPGEKLCGRCGMRLAVPIAPEAAGGAPRPAVCSCGAAVRSSLCPVCGARHA